MVKHKNKSSSICKHLLNKHRNVPKDLDRYFSVLKKSTNKFDCLVYEMLQIRELLSNRTQFKQNYLRDITYSNIMLILVNYF